VRSVKLLFGALLVGGLVLALPELVGAGPRVDFAVGQRLAGGALLVPLGLIFAGGLLTALTPCVYPLIPITLSVFGAKQASRARAIGLTLVYILGIAVMFTSLGVAAAKTGSAFGTVLSNPWVVGLLAALFAAFAASMFGAFDFALPAALQSRLSTLGKAGYGGALAMGLAAGVVAAPCTGPVLSGVLVYVATTQNVPLGALLLFTYALGLGAPFFLIGALSLSLPKSGAWMEAIKSVFGIALLALSVLYLRDAFPKLRALLSLATVAYGALLASALVSLGVLAGAVHKSFHSWPAEGSLKAAGVVLAVLGLSLRPGAPVASPRPPADAHWLLSEEAALAQSRASGRPLIVDFTAEWCTACKELERDVYASAEFVEEAKRFVLVKIDGTDEDSPSFAAAQQKYRVAGMPTVVFIDASGKERDDLRVTGNLPLREFVDKMRAVR
jgi:thioredoxin:protein disulfide reductase